MEDEQDARRASAIAVSPEAWRRLSIKERIQTYSDGQFLSVSKEWLDKLLGEGVDPEYAADFKRKHPFEYRMARALWLELTD